jgi:hypothetical protein
MLSNWKVMGQSNINLKNQSSNIEVPGRNISNIFLRSLINKHDDWSTDTDDIEVEEEGNNENEGMEMEDTQSSSCESSDVDVDEEYAKWKEQFEQDHELELKESILDKLYEKALAKLLSEHSTNNQFSKLREDKLESILYYATTWNDYINHIKLDKALEGVGDD